MSRPNRAARSRFLFQVRCAEPLEPRLLLATGPASMVKDLNAVTAPSDPFSFVEFKGATYFRANDGVHGVEWFRTDGTAGGTSLLADVNPGAASSYAAVGDARAVTSAAVLGDTLLFAASAPGSGAELWKTDGTAAGTMLVKDIFPGAGSSNPQRFTAVGDTMYFTADDRTSHRQIWKTDGTAEGTQIVTDIPGTSSLNIYPLGALGGRLIFGAPAPDPNGTAGAELWSTDGEPGGVTALLKNIHPTAGSNPGLNGNGDPVVAMSGGQLFFAAADNVHGRELWKTDGTADGTLLVAEMAPGTGGSSPAHLTDISGNLYFTAKPNGFDSSVYRRDPTGAVTELTVPGLFPINHLASPGSAGNVGGVFYLGAWYNNAATLFKYDPAHPGPTQGLTVVKQLAPATNWSLNAGPILDVNGKAVLLAQGTTGDNSVHLWRSDGTAQGTIDLATFRDQPIPDNDVFARWHLARGAGGLLYFAGAELSTGTEPYRTDGTEEGTALVKDLNVNTLNSDPTPAVYLGGGRSVFTADDPEHGRELWVTNGTAAGTSLLKDIYPGTRAAFRVLNPDFSPVVNGRTYFAASSSGDEVSKELWTTDGTPAGTYRLPTDLPQNFQALHGKVYFTGRDTAPGDMKGGLWETDGTVAGTRFVAPLDGAIGPIVGNGGRLYFTLFRFDTGGELWESDGTPEGTQRVRVLSPSTASAPSTPAVMNGIVYLTAPTADGTPALWRSDGTAGGTSVVKTLPGRYSHVQAVGHRLLLSRGEQGQPVESDVWVSDGTEAGTVPLASLVPDLQDFKAEQALGDPQMTVAGDAAYFFGHVGDGDPGVWRTDGTAAGTRLVHTFARGTRLNPAGVVDGLLYFATGTQLFPTGSQLWRTDGTDAGTVLVQDMAAGSLTPAGGSILFSGFEPAHGWELWAMPRDVTEVYVRGTAWANSFKSYLQDHDLGADGYGYRINGKQPPGVLPWVNLDQVVVRVPLDRIEGMPSPGNLSITSQRGGPAYTVTAVNAVPGDPQAFVFLLNRPLGGTDADATRNGDHLTLTMPGLGPQGTNLVLPLDVLQGDVDGSGVVLADDFSAVKKKFFRFVGGPAGGSDPAFNYSPFHDVDGSAAILANDFSEVKKRFFQAFPTAPTAAGIAASFARRPLGHPLFGAKPVLG